MTQPVNLKLELNLLNQSALSFAFAVWRCPVIQQEIKRHGPELYIITEKEINSNQKNFTEKIGDKVQKLLLLLNLPSKALSKVKMAVTLTEEKVFDWFVYVVNKEMFTFEQASRFLHGTSYGGIDMKKFYEELKRDIFPNHADLDFCSWTKAHADKLMVYSLASGYGDIKFIRANLEEVAKLISGGLKSVINDFNASKVTLNSAMTILMLWLIGDGNLTHFSGLYSCLKFSNYRAGTDKMFEFATFAGGCKKGAEYFYRKLRETDRLRILNQVGLQCISTRMNDLVNFERSRMPEILLYVLSKMSDQEKNQFIRENFVKVYCLFLKTTPYQQLCMQIVDYFFTNLQHSVQLEILEHTLEQLTLPYRGELADAIKLIYQPILEKVLERLPKDAKMNVFLDKNHPHMLNYCMTEKFEIINILLGDPDLKQHRFELLDISVYLGIFVMETGKSYLINNYMTNLNFSKEERKRLLINFGDFPMEALLCKGYLDAADDVINWKSELENKELTQFKKAAKGGVNVERICWNYISKGRCELLEDFLNWRFDNNLKKIGEVKQTFFATEAVCEGIWMMWMKRVENELTADATRKNCLKNLKYFCKTNEEVKAFKETMLKDQKFLHNLYKGKKSFQTMSTIASNVMPMIDVICKSFLMTNDEIKELKGALKNNFTEWFVSYYKELKSLNHLLKWICDTEEEKKNIIAKVLNSEKGMFQCVRLLQASVIPTIANDYWVEAKNILLQEWIKPYGFIDKVKTGAALHSRRDSEMTLHLERVTKLLNDLCSDN